MRAWSDARPTVEWEAGPPNPIRPYGRTSRPAPYSGPPAYPAIPRWGFPPIAWRSLSVGRRSPDAVARLRPAARGAVVALWTLVVLGTVLFAAEVWRYALILLSRDRLLPAATVLVSDVFVVVSGVLAAGASALSLIFTLLWVLRARQAGTEVTGLTPYRPTWQVYCALVVPGLNALLAGVVLTELEHAANRQPVHRRPRPSRTLALWWLAWLACTVFAAWALILGLFTSAQARADGVVIHALADLAAVVAAVLTIRVITSITAVLSPVTTRRRLHYVPRRDAGAGPDTADRAGRGAGTDHGGGTRHRGGSG